ncbi:hypothetical protein B1810_01390 [Panacagrimonas perspica]|nr:hypothetical protein B1810_01390 [Panacagrimonas perspica]
MGLGDIKVKSGLNQRFSAVIPFTSLTPEEAANVRARVAENQDFARAGLDRSGYLSSIRVEAITDGANPRLELSSGEIAREPLLTLLIEVRKTGGTRMLREYTVLLDPAVTSGAGAPMGRAQSAASDSDFFQTPEEARGGSTPRRSAEASASPRSSSVGADGLYGPVRDGETLWMIAQAVKPAGVGLDQAMLALYEANRDAFRGGDIEYLRSGSRLQVPDADTMQKFSNAAARARVLELSAQQAAAAPSGPASSSTLSSSAFPPAQTPKPAAPADVDEELTPATPPPAASVPASPPATTETVEAPGASAPAGDQAAGDVDMEGVGQTPATPPTTTTATDVVPAAETPAAGEPPVDSQATIANWLTRLLPVFIALIVLLIAVVVWRAARERKAQRDYEKAARETTRIPAPRMGATGSFQAKSGNSARDELEELGRQIDDDDATRIAPIVAGAADDDQDRTRMVTTSKIPAYPPPIMSDRPMDEAELAVTSQFQANTKEIKLGDNDPLSEADFHLAYGLYDEAALLLQQASARSPGRTDLRVKLAETYFAAGKATEFEQIAGTLKGDVSSDEWSKLSIMGRQLAPASDLFAAGAEGSNTDTVLDLTFDDDVAQIVPVKVDEGLEFNLEELELPSKTDQLAAQASQSLEFDLGEFDLGGVDKPKTSTPPPANAVIDFKEFDLGGTDVLGPGKSELDVRLDELEPMVIDDPMEEGQSAGDDATTSLNLARVYVEMGDAEMAQSLLEQVTKTGTDEQKREAEQLRERLLG